ncbi:MAG TPA: alcohol dehydrogenase catalytic domain-containing protein [Dehalococcoidia bacterium]|nr:alcohol dehydrogenase catalytic domain-containing protein [Dehalococcoidia bacterium]
MKAVVFTKRLALDVVDLGLPEVGPDEVRVKVAYSGICGSDLHRLERTTTPAGMIMGHEFCGTVEELGRDVSGWAAGERVVILPMVACGKCWGCQLGRPELCEHGLLEGPGMGRAGGYAEYVSLPARMLRRLPADLSMQHAALVEPLSVALHGIAISGATPEDKAVVLGSGPIGLFAAIGLRARGFKDVLVIEANEARRDKVASLGFRTAAPADAAGAVKEAFGRGATVAFDCTGHPSGLPLALELLLPASTLVVVGIPDEPVSVSLRKVAVDEVSIKGSIGYDDADYDEAIEHISKGRVPCDEITTIAPLADAQHWFEVLIARTSNELKVLLQP